MRPAVSVADALTALHDLSPRDDAAREGILKCLGLERGPTREAVPSLGAWQPTSTESVEVVQRRETTACTIPGPPVAPPPPPDSRDAAGIGTIVTKIKAGTGRPPLPAWLAEPGEALGNPGVPEAPLEQTPLFARLSHRGILTACLATPAAEGEIDVEEIIANECEGQPLTALPRLPLPTLRRGAQVLVDLAPGLDPFQPDQRLLLAQLDNILADDRLEVLRFRHCPGRGAGKGPRRQWAAWKPPAAGTPVLLVTDLGIGVSLMDDEPATTVEWLRFGAEVRAAGCPLLALVPYEARRWPGALMRAITLIHWSERTTVRHVRRALRHARYHRA